MFGLLKRRQEKKKREASNQLMRRQRLRGRLYQTTSEIVEAMMERHDLRGGMANEILKRADAMQKGFDLVLVDGLSAFDHGVPEQLQSGAMIAQSADAYCSLSESLDQPELAEKMGSLYDKDTVGGIFYQLGFSRDGASIRNMASA